MLYGVNVWASTAKTRESGIIVIQLLSKTAPLPLILLIRFVIDCLRKIAPPF